MKRWLLDGGFDFVIAPIFHTGIAVGWIYSGGMFFYLGIAYGILGLIRLGDRLYRKGYSNGWKAGTDLLLDKLDKIEEKDLTK